MPIKYIQHKGKTILYIDYSNLTGDKAKDAIALLDEAAKEMQTWKQKGLVLSNFRNTKANTEFMSYAKKLGKEVFAEKLHKSACIGITGVQSILLQAYNAFTQDKIAPFATEEEAKEWLIKD